MPAHSLVALAMLGAFRKAKRKYSDVPSYDDEREAYERRLPLFTGRGIVCLGAAPRKSERKDPQDQD
jgi:hypothetical protein